MMKSQRLRNFALMIVSGLLYGLSFPPFDLHLLMFVSMGLLLFMLSETKSLIGAAFSAYTVYFTAGITAISWISLSGMQDNADRFLVVAGAAVLFIYPLFFVLPSVVFRLILGRSGYVPALVAFPFVWTAFEYLSTLGQITFPWLLSGNSQTSLLSKIQFIEFTGVFGISFWICAVSALLFYSFRLLASSLNRGHKIKAAIYAGVAVLVYFLPDLINPNIRSDFKAESQVSVGIVQPNIDPWKKWGGKQSELIGSYIKDIEALHKGNPGLDLAVIPETAFPFYFKEASFEASCAAFKRMCDSLGMPVLAGTPDLIYYEDPADAPSDARLRKQSGIKYDAFNSAVLFIPGMEKEDYPVYHKMKLVPGSERMPYQEKLPFIKDLIEWGVGLSGWQIGRDTLLFRINRDVLFNTAICYESVFPSFFAGFINRGAEFSVIITNDGWWGELAGTHQHSRYAVLRAVENRRWIARCANTGISSFIDPDGNMHDATGINMHAMITKNVGLIREKTFYTKYGDVFSTACLWITLAAVSASLLLRKVSPKG